MDKCSDCDFQFTELCKGDCPKEVNNKDGGVFYEKWLSDSECKIVERRIMDKYKL